MALMRRHEAGTKVELIRSRTRTAPHPVEPDRARRHKHRFRPNQVDLAFTQSAPLQAKPKRKNPPLLSDVGERRHRIPDSDEPAVGGEVQGEFVSSAAKIVLSAAPPL
ncbi:hypothetical protein PR202_ga20488 [Eleusine coracana subsp. coracana]|uniref:Uncharacterized protein n=1 Tax=Eleusine coracana subsp. coracana TaxID=191504 RepID=A0AAV5CYV5_ELECO|nr:hypothetical protein PR202_ga20488 [Eleusine coracana subsp. coracana]